MPSTCEHRTVKKMLPKHIRDLLTSYLIDVSRLTHVDFDETEGEEYWKVFNVDTMKGFEINYAEGDLYYISTWETTSFFIELSLNTAVEILLRPS